MVEENDNQSAEELRRRIQERLESLNAEEKKEEAKSAGTDSPVAETPKVEAPAAEKVADKKAEAPGAKKVEPPKPDAKSKEPIKKVNTSSKPPKDEESKGNGFIYLLIGLLIVAIGLFTWQYMKSTELETVGETSRIGPTHGRTRGRSQSSFCSASSCHKNRSHINEQTTIYRSCSIAIYLLSVQHLLLSSRGPSDPFRL